MVQLIIFIILDSSPEWGKADKVPPSLKMTKSNIPSARGRKNITRNPLISYAWPPIANFEDSSAYSAKAPMITPPIIYSHSKLSSSKWTRLSRKYNRRNPSRWWIIKRRRIIEHYCKSFSKLIFRSSRPWGSSFSRFHPKFKYARSKFW